MIIQVIHALWFSSYVFLKNCEELSRHAWKELSWLDLFLVCNSLQNFSNLSPSHFSSGLWKSRRNINTLCYCFITLINISFRFCVRCFINFIDIVNFIASLLYVASSKYIIFYKKNNIYITILFLIYNIVLYNIISTQYVSFYNILL